MKKKPQQLDDVLDRKEEKTKTQDPLIKLTYLAGSYPTTNGVRFTTAQKLAALRQHVLEDPFITEELTYYVPPNGQSFPGSDASDPLQPWIEKALHHSEARVVLIKGQGGAGKSTFNRHLLRVSWQNPAWKSWKPGDAPPLAFAPIFIPLGSSIVEPKNLLIYLSHLPAPLESFSEEEINVLKSDYAMLLITDGYDEMPGQTRLNLYDVNGLDRYEGRVKLLISSRILEGREKVENSQFAPHCNEGLLAWNYYRERYIAPFTDQQIVDYLTQFVEKNKGRTDTSLWPDAADYQKHFATMPELRTFITTPFLLWMTVEVLPEITREVEAMLVSKSAGEEKAERKGKTGPTDKTERQALTRAKLYHHFMAQWFARQAQKAVLAGDILEDPAAILGMETVEMLQSASAGSKSAKSGNILTAELLQLAYQRFCETLAMHLHTEGRVSVQYPPESKRRGRLGKDKELTGSGALSPTSSWAETLFAPQEADWLRIRKGCPLHQNAAYEHQFLHASLIDYFVMTLIAAQAQVTTQEKAKPPAPAIEVEVRRKGRLGASKDNQESSLIAQRLLPRNTVQLSADDLKEVTEKSHRLHAYYYELIERSKIDATGAIAAANAITILNAAGENFSSRDFRGIRIAGADLSGGLFDRTDFTGADLQQVLLQGAWAYAANFQRAQVAGLRFGEEPCFEVDEKVTCCALSPDEQQLAVGLRYDILLFDIPTRRFLQIFTHAEWVTSIDWNPDGQRFTSSSWDGTVRVWDAASGQELNRFIQPGIVNQAVWDARGERIASAGLHDNKVRIWDVKKNKELICLHTGRVHTAAWHPDGLQVATGGDDRAIKIYDVGAGRQLSQLIGHTGNINMVVWDPNGKRLASSAEDETIRVWDTSTGQELRKFIASARTIAWDVEGKWLASGGGIGIVQVWDVNTGKELRKFNLPVILLSLPSFPSVIWSKSGERLICAGSHCVRVLNMTMSAELHPFSGFSDEVTTVAWDRQGTQLASGSSDKTVRTWDIATGRELSRVGGYEKIRTIAWDAQGKRLAFNDQMESDKPGEVVNIWELADSKSSTFAGFAQIYVSSVTWDATGERMAFGGNDNSVEIWSIKKGYLPENTAKLIGHRGQVSAVDWNQQGDKIAAGGMDSSVQIWDVVTRKRLHNFLGHEKAVTCVVWNTKGNLLASSSNDTTVRVWDAVKGKQLCQLNGHKEYVWSVSWDFSGEQLVSGSLDNMVKVWQVTTGQCLLTLTFPGTVRSLSWRKTEKEPLCAISFNSDIACYRLNPKNAELDLRWLARASATLWLMQANMKDAIGLNSMNMLLLRQYNAIGLATDLGTMNEEEKNYYLGKEKNAAASDDYLLGICCRRGYGMMIDLRQSIKHFKNAAEKNHPRAQYYMGLMYKYGDGIGQDGQKAQEFFKRCFKVIKKQAESKQDAWAAYTLASMYQDGEGVDKNPKLADTWFRIAVVLLPEIAKRKVLQAQIYLGGCYQYGTGIDKDAKAAVYWYRLAAEGGYPHAQSALGFCLEQGDGVQKNLEEAMSWYHKASAQGESWARSQLKKLSAVESSPRLHAGEGEALSVPIGAGVSLSSTPGALFSGSSAPTIASEQPLNVRLSRLRQRIDELYPESNLTLKAKRGKYIAQLDYYQFDGFVLTQATEQRLQRLEQMFQSLSSAIAAANVS